MKIFSFILTIILFNITYSQPLKHNFDISLKNINGKSNEYVYDLESPMQISELEWEIKNIPVLSLGYTYNFLSNWNLNLAFEKNFSSQNSGNMKDYDWNTEKGELNGTPYAYSNNKNRVETLENLDFNIQHIFSHTNELKSGPFIGVKYNNLKFVAKAGKQETYTGTGLIDSTKDWENKVKGVEYSQKFTTPYIGYFIEYTLDKLKVQGNIKGSNLGKATVKDTHFIGNSYSKEKYKNIKNLSFEVSAIYPILESLDFNCTFQMDRFYKSTNSKTNMTFKDGTSMDIKDKTGTKSFTTAVSLGLTYKF